MGAGGVTQWLRVLPTPAENLGLVFMSVYNSRELDRGLKALFWLLWAPGMYMVHRHTEKTHMHIKRRQVFLKNMLNMLIRKITKYFNTFALRQTTFTARNFLMKTTPLRYNLYTIKFVHLRCEIHVTCVIPSPRTLKWQDYKIEASVSYIAQLCLHDNKRERKKRKCIKVHDCRRIN